MTANRFGPYTLIQPIGVSTMAEVFIASRVDAAEPAVPVVLKRIHPDRVTDPRFIAMFCDEARIAMRLRHPGIVRVFQLEEINNQWAMVMEHIDGLNLAMLLQDLDELHQRLPPCVALLIAHDIAQALHHAHTLCDPGGAPLSIVHRDICPANVLLSRGGEVKVTDFGIAHSRLNTASQEGCPPQGHLSYMSPEQLRHAASDLRSDLFSLGVILLEMLTGQRLVRADPLSQLQAPRPPALDAILFSLLKPDPGQRPADAGEVCRQLAMLLPAPVDRLRHQLAELVQDTNHPMLPPAPEMTSQGPLPLRHNSLLDDDALDVGPAFIAGEDWPAPEETSLITNVALLLETTAPTFWPKRRASVLFFFLAMLAILTFWSRGASSGRAQLTLPAGEHLIEVVSPVRSQAAEVLAGQPQEIYIDVSR